MYIYFEEKDLQIVDSLNEEDLVNNMDFPEIFLQFSSRITKHSNEYLSCRILIEINYISAQISQLWHKYIEMIRYFPMEVNHILSYEFHIEYKEKLSLFLKKSTVRVEDTSNLLIPIDNKIAETNRANAIEIRKVNTEAIKQDLVKTFLIILTKNHFIYT